VANEVRKILPIDDGSLCVATWGGISIFDGSSFKHLRKEDGLPDEFTMDLYRAKDGAIWICTGSGVARFEPSAPLDKRFRSYTSANGLIPGLIGAVCQTPDGAMWFGHDGLSRFDGSRFTTFSPTNSALAHILKMTASKDGTLWIGTATALVQS